MQVSGSSQELAEGSSEQASSLEEVSSSLEEMTSMTKQNSENTRKANIMSEETQQAAHSGVDAMQKLVDAINRIKTSSDETALIIKTIDEIAFQTNLLALNAAVEAARAGDAGMGFAVVAEEVRNLAQRCANAAKETAQLIEESKSNTENGVRATDMVANTLSEIEEAANRVQGLISEVNAAGDEQAQGIGQINSAIAQMDQVTQATAANAEESASASEELSSQSRELHSMVELLMRVIEGGKTDLGTLRLEQAVTAKRVGGNGSRRQNGRSGNVPATTAKAQVVGSDDIIELDDEGQYENF
jgi:methyl-accepting chemotaxis protein